jgi:processive 1,2-diacylglycerol beta-glucosyltransferase
MPADHPTRFTVHGYTNAMRELMAAADLLVGKPGGLTSSEALASGLPMAIVAPLPGQEECNSDHLLELGVAIRCRDRGCLGWKVAELLDDRERLTAMRSRAFASAKPGAARCIARTLLAVHEAPAPISFTAAVPA